VRANVFWWHKDTAVSKSASLEGKVKLSLSWTKHYDMKAYEGVDIYIYIYIYRERERERERDQFGMNCLIYSASHSRVALENVGLQKE
jgi:hypothetical protein